MCLIFLCFASCEKEKETLLQSPETIELRNDRASQDQTMSSGERKLMILGERKNNPFTIENINLASAIFYGEGHQIFEPTDRHVKFMPTTQEHIVALDKWSLETLIPYFDYPMDSEIIEEGDYYIDPEVSDPLYTYQYATLSVEQELPNVPSEILDELYINFNNPLLLATSFDMTGHSDEINSYVMKGGIRNIEDLDPTNQSRIPELPIECPDGCNPVLILNDAVRPFTFEWACECEPGPPNLNACGCPIPSNDRYPAGCVRVQNDIGNEGVILAQVKLKDGWVGSDIVFTDENGCFVHREEYAGNMSYRVIFANENCEVRNFANLFGAKIEKDRIIRRGAPPYNQFSRLYDAIIDRRDWANSHSLNTDFNYRNAARADGIPQPRKGINILLRAGNAPGAAPMLQGNPYNSNVSVAVILIFPFNVINFLTTGLQPDIVNLYGPVETSTGFNNTGFHEYGHSSHHAVAGESFWRRYRDHIIANNFGWGTFPDLNGDNGKKCALGEGVACYIENRYGTTAFGVNVAAGGEGIDFLNNFVPVGLLFDLQDTNDDMVTDPNTLESITETTNGFTPKMFFDALDTPIGVKSFGYRLKSLHLTKTPNNEETFDSVIDIYNVFD